MLKREGFHHHPRPWEPTERQHRVLDAVSEGLTNDEIARRLGISADGVKWHVSELLSRTELPDRYALGRWWQGESRKHRGILPVIGLSVFRVSQVAILAVVAIVALAALMSLLPARNDRLGGETSQPRGLGVSETGSAGDSGVGAQAPQGSLGKPFFMQRQLDYAGFTTVRLSGGGLEEPITVPFVEFNNACNTVPGNGPSCAVSGDPSSTEIATWPEPEVSRTRYSVEFVQAGADPGVHAWYWYTPDLDVAEQRYWYVPGEPSLIGPLDDYGWVALDTPAADLFDRYIALGEAGAIAAEPTLAQGLDAAMERFGVQVSLSHGHTGGETRGLALGLSQATADELVGLLGQAEPAVLAVRGSLIGQRGYDFVRLDVSFGAGLQTYYYVPPGQVADRGVLVNGRALDTWGYVPSLSPPGYFTDVLSVPPAFDRLMGYSGGRLDASIQSSRIESELTSHWRFIDRIEIWREGEEHAVLPPLERQPCPQGCKAEGPAPQQPAGELPRRLPSFPGDPLRVAIWPTGPSYLSEAVQPALYDYYLDDGSGRAILVETRGPSLLGGSASAGYMAFYPPSPLDEALREAAFSLP